MTLNGGHNPSARGVRPGVGARPRAQQAEASSASEPGSGTLFGG